MKRILSIILLIVISLTIAIPLSAENPTKYKEVFTLNEVIAFYLGSKCTYNIVWSDGTVSRGTVVPEVIQYSDYFNADLAFMYLPIPELRTKQFTRFDLIFNLPFTISKCNSIEFKISPCVVLENRNVTNYPQFFNNFKFTYQADNTSAPSGNQVIKSYSTNLYDSTASPIIFTFADSGKTVLYRYSSNYSGAPCKSDDLVVCSMSNMLVLDYSILNCQKPDGNGINHGQDIDSFGFSYYGLDDLEQNGFPSSGFLGIAFSICPITIKYEDGGGYSPTPDNPDDKGEYAEQLDKIYDELVEQGVINQYQNQQIIQGQQEIISGQEEIKEAIDGLSQPDEETQQATEDFNNKIDESDQKLDDLATDLEIESPDLEDLDLSIIDDNFDIGLVSSVFSPIFGYGWIVTLLLLSMTFSIIGVVIHGKHDS